MDPFTGVDVAIKIAHKSTFGDPLHGARFKKMFMNEASLAGKMRHPYIVKVFDAGVEHDMHYIVMEYVDGTTLKAYSRPDTLLPINEVLEIAFKCSNALDYANRQGLIHRDIKPANLLTTGGTEVKITDFGAALLVNSDLTQVMDAVGTPSYMAPEQISGKEVSIQSDIYSLGVVMFQMLCGKLPFSGENQFELIQKITSDEPRDLSKLRADLPSAVTDIVQHCIQKNPANRYTSWTELAQDLSRANERLDFKVNTESSDARKFTIMKRLSFFQDFTDVELWELLRISKWRRFSKNKKLLAEGKIGGSCFILASGEARIMKNDAFLGQIEAGQPFGEMAYISGQNKPRTANVVSNTDVLVMKIKNDALTQASDPLRTKFNQVLLKILAERLEKTSAMASTI
ncbi:MAG: protein kinase [Gammaproteobacteria bacterium]|nr:protein kinase [Gammaproteobacteria bacterium]